MSVLEEIWDRGVSCFMIIASQLLYIWWLYEYFLKLWEFLEFLKLCKIVIVARWHSAACSLHSGPSWGTEMTWDMEARRRFLHINMYYLLHTTKRFHPSCAKLTIIVLCLVSTIQPLFIPDVRVSSKYDMLVVTWMRFRHMRPPRYLQQQPRLEQRPN